MATRKGRTTKGQLPEGYSDLTAKQAPVWEPSEGDMVEGECVKVREVPNPNPGTKRMSRIMEVQQDDGERIAVWDSYALSDLFDVVERGDRVIIIYDGEGEVFKEGQNPPKLFRCGRIPKGQF